MQPQETEAEPTADEAERARGWLKEIELAKKRLETWHKQGKRTVDIQGCSEAEEIPFNVLYSNTEILEPAIYNRTPRPMVRLRHPNDSTPVSIMATRVLERSLQFYCDTGDDDHATFDGALRDCLFRALVPGLSTIRVRYMAPEVSEPAPSDIGADNSVTTTGVMGETTSLYTDQRSNLGREGAELPPATDEIGFEVPAWDRYLWGWARRWGNVPWRAYEWSMTRRELVSNFGEAVAEKMTLAPITITDNETKTGGTSGGPNGATVYEIWNKNDKMVRFVSEQYKDGFLKEVEDPLQIAGFFSESPEPLFFMHKVDSTVPVPPYHAYKVQAEEINRLTGRIKRVAEAIKVRGFYDARIANLDALFADEDNALEPAECNEIFNDGSHALENHIWFMPTEQLVQTLQTLMNLRPQVKDTIYEIMGMADIMRGSTEASETLGAQDLKQKFGSLRLRRYQLRMAVFARDTLRVVAAIMCKHFPIEKFQKISGITMPADPEVLRQTLQDRQMQFQQAQAQYPQAAQMAKAQGQPPPPPPQPPAQPPPEARVTWSEVYQFLKGADAQFLIDVEVNSTIDQILAEDKKDIEGFLGAMGQIMQAIGPLVEQQALPFDVVKAMVLAVARRYDFGRDVEEALEQLKPPAPPQPSPDEKMKAQVEMAREQMALKESEADHQFKMQELQQKGALSEMKHRHLTAKANMDMAKVQQEMQKMQLEAQLAPQLAAAHAPVQPSMPVRPNA